MKKSKNLQVLRHVFSIVKTFGYSVSQFLAPLTTPAISTLNPLVNPAQQGLYVVKLIGKIVYSLDTMHLNTSSTTTVSLMSTIIISSEAETVHSLW